MKVKTRDRFGQKIKKIRVMLIGQKVDPKFLPKNPTDEFFIRVWLEKQEFNLFLGSSINIQAGELET